MKRVAILTNGGDAPGLNAVIRAIVKTAEQNGVECYDYIMNLPKSKTKLGNYEIKYYVSDWFGRYELKYPCNNEYIDKLISVLNE